MKKGQRVKVALAEWRIHGGLVGRRCRAGLISLSPPRGRTRLDGRLAPVAHLLRGPSCGHGGGGACWGEGTVAGEHVPDRLRESAGEVDLGDLGATLLAEPGAGALVAVPVGGVLAGVAGRLDQRPAQVARARLAERATAIAFTRLVDARAEAGVAGQLARRAEAGDVADLAGDRVREHPGDARDGGEQRDVAMIGTESTQVRLARIDLPVELVDQAQARLDVASPRLRQGEAGGRSPGRGAGQSGGGGRAGPGGPG